MPLSKANQTSFSATDNKLFWETLSMTAPALLICPRSAGTLRLALSRQRWTAVDCVPAYEPPVRLPVCPNLWMPDECWMKAGQSVCWASFWRRSHKTKKTMKTRRGTRLPDECRMVAGWIPPWVLMNPSSAKSVSKSMRYFGATCGQICAQAVPKSRVQICAQFKFHIQGICAQI